MPNRDITLADPVNFIDPDGRFFTLGTAAIGFVAGGLANGIHAAMNGESFLKGAAIGATAGLLAGLTLNPMIVGAIIGATTTTANTLAGIDDPCDFGKNLLIGTIGGAAGGWFGGHLAGTPVGEIAAPVGETAGAVVLDSTLRVTSALKGMQD